MGGNTAERQKLVAYLSDSHLALYVRRVLSPRYQVVALNSPEEAEHELLVRVYEGLLVGRTHRDGSSCLGFVRRVRSKCPSVAIILYCAPEPALFDEIVAFSRVGIDALVLRGADDLPATLHRVITNAARQALGRYALSLLEPRLSPQVASIVSLCLMRADEHVSVDEIAHELGVTRKTLATWTAASRSPSPAMLIGWSRLLAAARLLEDPGRSIESIAHTLRFNSASALNNLMRRYVDQTPGEVRRNGAVRIVLQSWMRQLETIRNRQP